MLYDIKEIKGGKIMTTEQMAKCQDDMQGKIIVAVWSTPCKPYLFVRLSVNEDKIKQMRKHDEYAGYMQDYDFEVKDGEGDKALLDGHNGTEYVVFEDLESARKAVKILNEIDKTDWVRRDLNTQIEVFNKIRITNEVCASVRNAVSKAKEGLTNALIACEKRNVELLEKLKG